MNRRIDTWLIAVVAILVALGLIMVYSASAIVAGEQGGGELRYFNRQIVAVGFGLLLAAGTAVTPTRIFRKYRAVFFTACIGGLVLCYIPGIQYRANGAARWIGFGSINVQPSEFAKIAVLLMVAHYLDRWRGHLDDWRVLVRGALFALPVMGLTFFQPDFGTTAIIGGLVGIMMVVAGARWRHLSVLGIIALSVGIPALLVERYRVIRLLSFLDPWKNVQGDGYQVIQGWMAMHSGGVWGQGLGNSIAKLHFLPEPWTDYIGAVIAEELGLIRLLLMFCLFGLFIWRGFHIARHARDAFGMFLAATLTAMVGFEAFFNLAVIMGMVPPKGLVLPFISYGASAMISHLWATGILLGIAAEADTADASEGWPERKRPIPAKSPSLRSPSLGAPSLGAPSARAH